VFYLLQTHILIYDLQTIVGVNAWALHRNADIFGSDVDEFRPERWLGLREDVARMEQFLYSV
jgi:cytochrome P450